MKKSILLIISIILFLPVIVNAESGYLYDVLKNEAESNGLAKEYTGQHHDSFTEEPSKKIYHWYAENDDDINEIINKSYVYFAGFCWKIIRTTDTGGTKLLLYGNYDAHGKKCLSITNMPPFYSFNNDNNSLAYVGYMYNPNTLLVGNFISNPVNNVLYGHDVSYDGEQYILNNTQNSLDNNHHYTCMNTSGTCRIVYFYYHNMGYLNLSNGLKIEDAINNMLYADDVNMVNSNIKNHVDSWYASNLLDYSDFIEDTIYCNDRSISNLNGWDANGGALDNDLYFHNNYSNSNLICNRATDKFSINNSKAKLTYPIGLITRPELHLSNLTIFRNNHYWTMSSASYNGLYNSAYGVISYGYITANPVSNSLKLRPVISLKQKTKYNSGNGSENEPYIIDLYNYYEVNFEIVNETNNINIELTDMTHVKYGDEVNFKVTPIKGYKVKNIRIVDENNNEIEYTTTDNKNYKFIMPSSDVTIIPSYEKVSNGVIVEDNENTKEFVIEVEDAKAVVYEDKVVFTVEPKDGYVLDKIIIKDKNNNKIEYEKISNNKYEFVMPDTDVVITPVYRKIESIDKSNNIINPKTVGPIITILILIGLLMVSALVRKKIRLNKDYL